LAPGVKNLSENIKVISIVGRFLEHSRIICFGKGNSLPNKNAKVFITSADWMSRNFDRRVETLVPIENKTVHEQILFQIMNTAIQDNQNAWQLNDKGEYSKINSDNSLKVDSHKYFMTNPSLSGQGSSVKKTRNK
jgi:polyphosphate kinase